MAAGAEAVLANVTAKIKDAEVALASIFFSGVHFAGIMSMSESPLRWSPGA